MAEEIPQDLTMLHKGKSDPNGDSFDELLKKSTRVGSTTPVLKTKADVDAYRQSIDDKISFEESYQAGTVDPELDKGQSLFEDVNTTRARNQSEGIKGLKAIGGGIYQGALMALEEAGYMADIQTYTNMWDNAEDFSGNWWTNLMKEAQDAGRESELFKIYEDQPEANSVMSHIFKWSSLESSVASAIGNGAVGLGLAKFVSALGNTRNFTKLAKFTDTVMGNITGAEMGGATRAFVGPLATSAMNEYFMGQMMATETYSEAMKSLQPKIEAGEMTTIEAQTLANENAQDVLRYNMAYALTGHIKFGNIFKKNSRFKGLVDNPSAMHELKNLVLKGSATEFAEEISQEILQMEQLYDVQKEANMATEFSENSWDRIGQMLLTDRALTSGAMGITGGPLQFAIIQGPFMGKQRKEQAEIYRGQQDALNWHKEVVANNFGKFNTFDMATKQAILAGKAADADFYTDLGVLDSIANSASWGTLGFLREDVNNIKNMTPEEAAAQGYDETYAETADKFLNAIDTAVIYGREHPNAYNTAEIVFNRLAHQETSQRVVDLTKKSNELRANLLEKINSTLGMPDVELSRDFRIVRNKNRFDGMSPNEKAALQSKEEKEDKRLDSLLGSTFEYRDLEANEKELKKYDKLRQKLIDRYDEITHPKYQERGKLKENKAITNLNNAVNNAKAVAEENENTENQLKYKPFSVVKAEAKEETVEQKSARLEGYAKDTEGRAVVKPDTFSSIDKDKKHRVYSPGDILRSHDGRMFKVQAQLATKNKYGEMSGVGMPIMYEVGPDGKELRDKDTPFIESQFVPDSHDFFRPEVLQYQKGLKGAIYNYQHKWAPYVQPDSLLKPKNLDYQVGRQAMLAKSQAKTVNVSSKSIQSGEHDWMDKYSMADLDKPFTGEYGVTLKMRDEGEGRKYVDVYRVDESGEVLLTRLDKDYNLNYKVITDALAKGPVMGKVVEHFSSSKNIVRVQDADGQDIHVSIAELKNMDPAYLPNGKIILAQTKGKYSKTPLDVAASIDGEVFDNGTVDIMRNGSLVKVDIPFHAMTPGDTYVLLVAPSGQIIPVATQTKSIGDITTPEGKPYTDVINDLIYESIHTVFKNEEFNREAEDAILRAKVDNDITLKEGKKPYEFRRLKLAKLREREKAFNDHLEETALRHIRNNETIYNSVKVTGEGGQEKDLFQKDAKGVLTLNERFFKVTFDVSKAGNIVPAVEVVNPRNTSKYHATKNPGGGTIFYNLEDHPDEYAKAMRTRRKRMSINDLVNPISEDGTNLVKALVNSGDLSTNINVARPFMGSSATIELIGEDIVQESMELLEKLNAKFEETHGDDFRKALHFRSTDKLVESREDFDEAIQLFLAPGDYGLNVEDLSLLETDAEIRDTLVGFVTSLNVLNNHEAVNTVMKATTEDLDDLDTLELDNIQGQLKELGVIHNLELVSKAVLGIQRLQKRVDEGELKLKPKPGRNSKNLSPAYIQPEGLTFNLGSAVYSEAYGEGKVTKVRTDGAYVVSFGNRKKSVNVLPSALYNLNGKMHDLSKDKKALARIPEGDPRRAPIERRIARLERDIEYTRKLRAGEIPTDTVGMQGSALRSANAIEAKAFLSDLFETAGGLSETMEEMLDKSLFSDRSIQLDSALAPVKAIVDNIDPDKDMNEDSVAAMYQALDHAIFYTEDDFKVMKSVARSTNNDKALAQIGKLEKIKKELNNVKDYNESRVIKVPNYGKSGKIKEASFEMLGAIIKEGGSPKLGNEYELQHFASLVIKSLMIVYNTESTLRADLFTPKASVAEEVVTPTKPTPAAVTAPAPTTTVVVIPNPAPQNQAPVTPTSPEDSSSLADDRRLSSEVMDRLTDSQKEALAPALAEESGATKEDITDLESAIRTYYSMGLDPSPVIKTFVDTHSTPTSTNPVNLHNGIIASDLVDKLSFDQKVLVVRAYKGASEEEVLIFEENLRTAFSMGLEVDSIINTFVEDQNQNPKFKLGGAANLSKSDFDREVAQVKEWLPQVPVEVLENVAEMQNKFGVEAVGAFHKGVRYLVTQANEGTAYHETFHAVADLYLTDDQKQAIADERGYDRFTLELEEKLAEEFETYAKAHKNASQKSLASKAVSAVQKFFNNLLSWFSGTRKGNATVKVFEKIVTGGYAKSKSVNIINSLDTGFNSVQQFKDSLSKKYNVILQGLLDENRINIVC